MKEHESRVWHGLLHGEEKSVWADKGCGSAEREAAFSEDGKVWGVMRKASKEDKIDPNKLRAKVERPFWVMKRRFGHMKIRFRRRAKNRAYLCTLFALDNLFLVRPKLMT